MRDLPELISLEQTTSTNSYLAELWNAKGSDLPEFLTVITEFQNAGRGRLGRKWVAPRGTSMLASILVPITHSQSSLLPLVAGSVVAELVQHLLPAGNVEVKWPNDVLVDGRKICGILCESLDENWSIVGIGINLSQGENQLPPVPSTSIQLEGGPDADAKLLALACVTTLQDRLQGDSVDLLHAVESGLTTLGKEVLVDLPSGERLTGTAQSLDADGSILIEDQSGNRRSVRAGDVTHLRVETPVSLATSQGVSS